MMSCGVKLNSRGGYSTRVSAVRGGVGACEEEGHAGSGGKGAWRVGSKEDSMCRHKTYNRAGRGC